MSDMRSKVQEIYTMEQLAGGSTCIHRLHPGAKMLTALVFIVTVVSFGRYELGRLIPYIFYPVIVMALSETPWGKLLKRLVVALPFVAFAAVSNIIFERNTALTVGELAISHGALSALTIVFRALLCVMSVLILISVTPFGELTNQMRRVRIPGIFVTLFELTYRYAGVLLEEASSMYTAYMLRSTERKGLEMRHMGSFVGQLVLRSFDRAERIYAAMKCRGYAMQADSGKRRRLSSGDCIYMAAVCIPAVLFRIFNVSELFSRVMSRLF